jgi:hypothetical protein
MKATARKSVNRRFISKVKFGSCYLLRITYTDGRKSWGVSTPGMLALFGSDRRAANDYVRNSTCRRKVG